MVSGRKHGVVSGRKHVTDRDRVSAELTRDCLHGGTRIGNRKQGG